MFYGTTLKENSLDGKDLVLEMTVPEFYSQICLSEAYIEDFEMFEEGANIEITKKAREFHKGFKEDIKSAKAAIKAKDSEKAKSSLKDARSKLEGFKKEVENMDSTAGSAIFGLFTSMIVAMARDAAFLFGTFGLGSVFGGITMSGFTQLSLKAVTDGIISVGGSLATLIGSIGLTITNIAFYIYSLYNLIVDISKIIKSLNKGEKTENAFNFYRVEMLKTCDKFEKILSKVENQIK